MDNMKSLRKWAFCQHADVGIYYVIRYPRSWKVYPMTESVFGDAFHRQVWRTEIVPELASAWASVLNTEQSILTGLLLPFPHAFPRGRIERVAVGEYTIFQGNDLPPTISQGQILNAFALTDEKVNWTLDPHEQCEKDQKDSIRNILKLTEDWAAV